MGDCRHEKETGEKNKKRRNKEQVFTHFAPQRFEHESYFVCFLSRSPKKSSRALSTLTLISIVMWIGLISTGFTSISCRVQAEEKRVQSEQKGKDKYICYRRVILHILHNGLDVFSILKQILHRKAKIYIQPDWMLEARTLFAWYNLAIFIAER